MKKELNLSKIGLDQLYKSIGVSDEELDPDKAILKQHHKVYNLLGEIERINEELKENEKDNS